MSVTKEDKDQINAIIIQVKAIANEARRSVVMARHSLGRCVRALQTIRADVRQDNNKPSYTMAKNIVYKAAHEVDDEITRAVIDNCFYVSERITKQQTAILAEAGISWCQLYQVCKQYGGDGTSSLRSYVSRVKSGEITRKQFKKLIPNYHATKKPDSGGPGEHERSLVIVYPPDDWEAFEDQVISLASLLGRKRWNELVQRADKTVVRT